MAAARRHHPHRQYTRAEQARGHDHQDDVHSASALVTRQTGKQQLARVFHKIFSHTFELLGSLSAWRAGRFRVVGQQALCRKTSKMGFSFRAPYQVNGLV